MVWEREEEVVMMRSLRWIDNETGHTGATTGSRHRHC